ncbi:30806_t:CDS:2, partial [Racocetra persica]
EVSSRKIPFINKIELALEILKDIKEVNQLRVLYIKESPVKILEIDKHSIVDDNEKSQLINFDNLPEARNEVE